MDYFTMQLQKIYPRPERPSDPFPLVMAIYNFELIAKKYHDEANKQNPDNEKLKKLIRDYDHLQAEKKRIESISIAQIALKEYRELNSSAAQFELAEEQHHPTNTLARYLFSVGEPKPTKEHEAHHIILGKGRYNQ